jgi:hypothetical protein
MAPFKKHLTPLSKHGRVVKHVGKGSVQQRIPSGGRSSLTGGDPLAQMQNQYPAAPQPTADQSQMPAPPMGGPPLGSSPPAAMGPGAGPPLPDDTSSGQ